jgi:hypothetical protein
VQKSLASIHRQMTVLPSQEETAKTFDRPLAPYPRVMRVYDSCIAIPAFADAHPARQPDAEQELPQVGG